MKQAVVFLFSLLIITVASAQITTTKIATKTEKVDTAPYDSTVNFLADNPQKYIGQELYLKGMSEILRGYGYDGFLLDYNKDKTGNVYKCCESYNSKYADLNGKYFKVLDVIRHPKALTGNSLDESVYGKTWFLKLEEKESKDAVYYEYKSEYKDKFPFIVAGFFEKQKKRVIGREFVFSDEALQGSIDIETGKPITIVTGQKWKCVDLTIEERYYNLALVLENSLGEKNDVSYDYVFGPSKGNVYTLKEAESYRKSLGTENFNVILQGKVKVGFTKEMCRLSWGKPKKVNETITAGKKSEQWVYADNYLYFENDVVTAIQ